jgi:hypothetical protein
MKILNPKNSFESGYRIFDQWQQNLDEKCLEFGVSCLKKLAVGSWQVVEPENQYQVPKQKEKVKSLEPFYLPLTPCPLLFALLITPDLL